MTPAEEHVKDKLEAKGYTVLKNGWPDFLVIDEKRGFGFAIEVKYGADRMSPEQELMYKFLRQLGLPVFVSKDGKIQNWKGARLLDSPLANRVKFELDVIKERFLFLEADLKRSIQEIEVRLISSEATIGHIDQDPGTTGTQLEP